MATYPNLPADLETRLKAVQLAADGVENYLRSDECPYSPGLRILLGRMLNGVGGGGGGSAAVEEVVRIFDVPDGDKYDVVLREVEATIEEMKAIERQLGIGGGGGGEGGGGDTGDRIQLVKAKTSLLEKWATLKERVLTLKEMSQFQLVIIGAMDDILTVDERAEFRDRLRNFASVGSIGSIGSVAK